VKRDAGLRKSGQNPPSLAQVGEPELERGAEPERRRRRGRAGRRAVAAFTGCSRSPPPPSLLWVRPTRVEPTIGGRRRLRTRAPVCGLVGAVDECCSRRCSCRGAVYATQQLLTRTSNGTNIRDFFAIHRIVKRPAPSKLTPLDN
jgi:hypothetical protein